MGEWALVNLDKGGYKGEVYPVNPRYDELAGRRCYGRLADLPEVPELAIFTVGDARIEAALDDAVAAGVPAAVIMSALALDDDGEPPLRDRVREKVVAAGLLLCGPNGMGFYNVRDRVWACGFDSAGHEPPGSVAIISHSGAGMSGIIDCEERLAINFAVSTGTEFTVGMEQYLDFVLDLPETRVVGLFVEAIRNPDGFRAALAKAARKRIPIVALKTGRTQKAAQMALSHAGALTGDDDVFDALCDRYGVHRVHDQDEWTTSLILFDRLHPVGDGGLVTLHDSGGERQLLIDIAADVGVPLTEIGPATRDALTEVLPPELPAVNPLDAWSRGGKTAVDDMARCFSVLVSDPDAAMGAVVHNRAPHGRIYSVYVDYMKKAHADTGKPVALVSARQGTGEDPRVVEATREGLPVLDGVRSFLLGVRGLFCYRDFLERESQPAPRPDAALVETWRRCLGDGRPFGEKESLEMLEAFSIATSKPVAVRSADEALEAASRIGFPLVLKTAQPGLAHKSDVHGVVTGIESREALEAACDRLCRELGADMLVAPMIEPGIEMILGARRDPQFGPVVVLGFGGVLAETLKDVAFALPPLDAPGVRRCLDRLRLKPLLEGVRGSLPTNVAAFCDLAARFSAMVAALDDAITEIDVNPVIVNEASATAVDALVVPKR